MGLEDRINVPRRPPGVVCKCHRGTAYHVRCRRLHHAASRSPRRPKASASPPTAGLPGRPSRPGAPLAPRAARPSARHRPSGVRQPATPTDPQLARAGIPQGIPRQDAGAHLRLHQPASQPARSVSVAGRYACTCGALMPATLFHRWCSSLLAVMRVDAVPPSHNCHCGSRFAPTRPVRRGITGSRKQARRKSVRWLGIS